MITQQTLSETCILTGASGFVGGRLKARLEQRGWRVIEWNRRPKPSSEGPAFQLGQEVDPRWFGGARALVHCAYDFSPLKWDDIVAINVSGSEKLFAAAREAGVEKLVFISSISAFSGCRSLYGRAKLRIEEFASALGAYVIRPGLVYGDSAGGMFGRLVAQSSHSRYVPVLVGCAQTQYLIHEEDLSELVRFCLRGQVAPAVGPISAAHDRAWQLREILIQISQALGRPLSFAPVPWWLVWAALKSLETIGAPAKFRSDSLISMVYQDPSPSFALFKSFGLRCRPFEVVPSMLAGAAK